MKYIIAIFLLSVAFVSCDKEDEPAVEYFIFGGYAGECFGNCANFYKIEDESLYPDDMDYFTHTFFEFKFQSSALENSKYLLAQEFLDALPDDLLNASETTFGTPDAYDQGGYFIVLKEKEAQTLKSWNIDTNKDVLPEYLKDYIEKLETLMEQLRE